MERVAAFIDGFNVYHSLNEHGCTQFKWLDYWNLADAFVLQSREQLVNVFYFTALTLWNPAKLQRQRTYIQALETRGVTVVYGKFKTVTRKCRAACRQSYPTFEEKETDINIAVRMLLEAARDSFDKALLFSGDSDMIAGVKALKELAPHKHIKVVIPYNRSSIDLASKCDSAAKIKRKHLANNQLPDAIELGSGTGVFLRKPAEWT